MSSNFIQGSRHGTVFHFRRRVPKDLVCRIGRSDLVRSLHTEQLAEARKRGRALAAATDELFTELRYMPSEKKPRSLRTHYGLGIELDPATGFLKKIQITDAKPEDASAISLNIEALMTGTSHKSAPGKPPDTTPTIAEAAIALLAAPGRKPTTRKRYANVPAGINLGQHVSGYIEGAGGCTRDWGQLLPQVSSRVVQVLSGAICRVKILQRRHARHNHAKVESDPGVSTPLDSVVSRLHEHSNRHSTNDG